ncbi:DUF2147 domain-containing protein [Dyadobacter sp. 32]|uniref:DUF2147 domain-containing protein n=1 Tax=Dyadobacter sp. 32 TaxID=538966 RepID=UPI0011EBBE6F
MKRISKSAFLTAGFLILLSTAGYGQSEIIGKWLNPDGDRKIEIYENKGSFFGKIIWLKNPSGKAQIGDIVLKDITYKNDHWSGKAYMPARDRDVDISISMKRADELEITGKVGVMSQKKLWKRSK